MMSAHRQYLKPLLTMFLEIILMQTVSASGSSSSNIQILRGMDFQLGEVERTIMTFEHNNRWSHGDNYFFVDVTEPSGKGTTHYAEFAPRLSISKLSGRNAFIGIIKDTFVAASFEMGDGTHASLIGLGVSLDIPGFEYSNANFLRRKSHRDSVLEDTGPGWQLTVNWGLPFTIKESLWLFEGFVDYALSEEGGTSPKANNMITAPRLLLDIGDLWSAQDHLFAGLEYQIWRNKFGVDDVDEDVAQAMLKWVF